MSKGSSLCVSVYRVTEWSLTCSTFYSAHIIPARKDDIFEGAQVESMLEAVLGGYHGTIVSEMGRLCDEAWGCTVCTWVASTLVNTACLMLSAIHWSHAHSRARLCNALRLSLTLRSTTANAPPETSSSSAANLRNASYHRCELYFRNPS